MQVDHLECGNGESVELTVRPMIVNTGDYSVAFQTKATLTIYDVFPVYDLDTENALISSLVVDDGKIIHKSGYMSVYNLDLFQESTLLSSIPNESKVSLLCSFHSQPKILRSFKNLTSSRTRL